MPDIDNGITGQGQALMSTGSVGPGVSGKAELNIDKDGHLIGALGGKIGTGTNAQRAISLLVIQYAFVSGAIASAYVFVIYSIRSSPDLMDSFKSIWGLFTPIITLAMGYVFGRGKD